VDQSFAESEHRHLNLAGCVERADVRLAISLKVNHRKAKKFRGEK